MPMQPSDDSDAGVPLSRGRVEKEARGLGDVLGMAVEWAASGDRRERWSMRSPGAPSTSAPRGAARGERGRGRIADAAEQFQRMATSAGADIERSLQ